MTLQTQLHGVLVSVPDGWQDQSVHRFSAPDEASGDPVVGQTFRSNMIVSRHRIPASVPLESVFDSSNEASRKQMADFRVVAAGLGRYLGQEASWQDTAFSDPRVKSLLRQRHIAMRAFPSEVVIITITAEQKRFEAATGQVQVEQAK